MKFKSIVIHWFINAEKLNFNILDHYLHINYYIMEETINLYISNMTKSINVVITCKRLKTILDLKELIAKN